jgi:hypothetical protein
MRGGHLRLEQQRFFYAYPVNRGLNALPLYSKHLSLRATIFKLVWGCRRLGMHNATYPDSLSTAIHNDTMTNCQGCGHKGLKCSGINLHCCRSHDPRCKEYLAQLKQAASIRTHRLRSPAEHTLTATLNVSPSTGEACQASRSL